MAKIPKLAELTPAMYMKYKYKKLSDLEIGRMYNASHETVLKWKKKNNLVGKINPRSFETWERFFPEKVAKLKTRYLELYNQGWKHVYISEELGMTRNQLTRFKDRYFPELVIRPEIKLTNEQKEIARQNGVSVDTALGRIRSGVPIDEAIRTPVNNGWRGDPGKQKIGKGFASDVSPVIRLKDYFTEEEIEKAYKKGLNKNVLYRRIMLGWTVKKILRTPKRRKKKK